MDDAIGRLVAHIRALQDELDVELRAKRDRFRYRLDGRRAVFEREIRARHKSLRIGLLRFLRGSRFTTILTAPVIYSVVVTLAFLDLMVALYQMVCFPAYGIPGVPRGRYVIIDRHRLA